MSSYLRDQLDAAAQENGHSLSQELQRRLNLSFSKEKYTDRYDIPTRALSFVIGETAQRVHFNVPLEWHRDPFLFRAFKLAVAQVLDALEKMLTGLEPTGEPKSPLPEFSKELKPLELQIISDHWITPEIAAAKAVESTLGSLYFPAPSIEDVRARLRDLSFPEWPNLSTGFEKEFYAMANARRDLGIDNLIDARKEPKS